MKQRILDVAAQKICLYGLKKFTVDEIAVELKISKKTIYKYFGSKDDIIREYFETVIASDKNSVQQVLDSQEEFLGKIHDIVHSTHKYTLPVALLNEAKLFYPEEWQKIEELKIFKLNAMKKLLEQGVSEGIIKPGVHFAVLCEIFEKMSNMFTDYDFLLENKLRTTEAIDEAIEIILHGILIEKSSDHLLG